MRARSALRSLVLAAVMCIASEVRAQSIDLDYPVPLMFCVYDMIPDMDDDVSSADVIAVGVVQFCLKAMCSKIECPKDAAEALPPYILPEVLQYRHDHFARPSN